MLVVQDYLPRTSDELLRLEPEELALPLLRYLRQYEIQTREGSLLLYNLTLPHRDSPLGHYLDDRGGEVRRRVTETWEVLDRRRWLTASPNSGAGQDWRTVSRAGLAALVTGEVVSFVSSDLLPKDMDAQLAAEVVSPFIGARFSEAVRNALRRVEVRVRKLASATSLKRREVMADALKPADMGRSLPQGPLAHPSQSRNVQECVRFLFEGAMGTWLNEHTHEDVAIDSADEAAEIIHFANLLLRIAARNAKALGLPI